jgi:hypothetical protein
MLFIQLAMPGSVNADGTIQGTDVRRDSISRNGSLLSGKMVVIHSRLGAFTTVFSTQEPWLSEDLSVLVPDCCLIYRKNKAFVLKD